MTLTVQDVTNLMTDNLQLVEAHVNVVLESTDVEAVRTSASALMNTEAGRKYLAQNPLVV